MLALSTTGCDAHGCRGGIQRGLSANSFMVSILLTLDKLRPGERARVRSCLGEGAVYQRLCEMGFVEGSMLRVVRYAPFGDPLEVELSDCHLSLRLAEAAMIQVEPLGRAEPGQGTAREGTAREGTPREEAP